MPLVLRLFGGVARRATLSISAWATDPRPSRISHRLQPSRLGRRAPLLLLTTTLGLFPAEDRPCCDAHLPREFGEVTLVGLPGRWGRGDITTEAAATAG